MKTIAQLATKYNVSRQSIYQRIKRQGDSFKEHVSKDDKGYTLIDEQGEAILFDCKDVDNEHIKDLQATIELLTTQLQMKDKQIDNLQELLSQSHTIMQTATIKGINEPKKRKGFFDWFKHVDN